MAAHRISALVAAAVLLGPATAGAQDDPVDPYAEPAKPAARPKDRPKAKPPEPPAELPKEQPVDPYGEAPPEEPPPPSLDPADDIDDQVAEALHARGQQLLQRGDAASAKTLFIECLERSPKGPRSSEALRALRAANKKLGLKNLDDGRPGTPVDPYGGGARGEQPLDPYGRRPGGGGGNGDDGLHRDVGPSAAGRRVVMAFSAGAGLVAGLALAGPESETTNDFGETTTEVGGGAVLAGLLGAGVGFAGSWWLTDRYPVTTGQSVAIASGASWGTLDLALFGDAVTGADSDPNDVWKFAAAGGLLGLGAGALYAARLDPSEEELVFVNSLGALGTGAGLLVGVGIQPPEREAYSINALVGSLGGLGIGVALADSADISSRRMLYIDLGAAAGAALPWALLYPLIKDGGTEDDEQAAGWLSALTLGGGAIAAWYLTRAMDEPDPAEASAVLDAAPPAVVQRTADGTWALGAPLPRPMQSPALAPPSGIALGADLVSGRF
jgi:hypothetical protein